MCFRSPLGLDSTDFKFVFRRSAFINIAHPVNVTKPPKCRRTLLAVAKANIFLASDINDGANFVEDGNG
jgi:hypothetical protein